MSKVAFSERLASHSIEIQTWKYSYSYIADPVSVDELDEFIHLEVIELKGKSLRAGSRKGLGAKLIIACQKPPHGGDPVIVRPVVGNLRVNARMLDAYVQVPQDHFTRIMAAVAAEKLRFASLIVAKLLKGKSIVRSIHLSTEREI